MEHNQLEDFIFGQAATAAINLGSPLSNNAGSSGINPVTTVMGNITSGVNGTYTTINTGIFSQPVTSSTIYAGSQFPQKLGAATRYRLYDNNSNVILEIDATGDVKWKNQVTIDEAARAFSQSIRLGAEIQSGINRTVKSRIRDTVFEEIINIAKQKGALTADDLTYLLESSKIMEKLSGVNIEE